MDLNQKHFARILLQNKILKSTGQLYEDLFTEIMNYLNPSFIQIKPQGQIGDRKNDGFDRQTGTYYQVYAPENLGDSIGDAVKKLEEDFDGLFKNWNDDCKIQKFYFVVNDRHKGAHTTLAQALLKIKNTHKLQDTGPYLTKDLENDFFKLNDEQILAVVGLIPTCDITDTLEFPILGEVVEYLFQNDVSEFEENLSTPSLDEKIQFNGLSSEVESLLKAHSYSHGDIDQFFSLNSDFAKQQLREIFVDLYQKTKDATEEIENTSTADRIFFEVIEKAMPSKNRKYHIGVLSLMAYFFESCDIFEPPEAPQG